MTKIKTIGVIAITAAALYAGGYATGRYATPAKVVTKEKIVEKQVVVTQVKTQTQIVYVKEKKQQVHTTTTEVKKPDGTVTKTTTNDTDTDTTVHADTIKYVDRWNEKIVEKTVEKEKLVLKLKKPAWVLGLQASSVVMDFSNGISLELNKPLMTGYVNRYFWGPLYGGVWVNSQRTTGLSIGISGAF